MKKLIQALLAIISSATLFIITYVVLLAVASFIAWENIFIADVAYKGVAVFLSIISTFMGLFFIYSED